MSRWCDIPMRLVLHADDFGMSRAVNAGIVCGFRDGLLTSTSLLANGPAAEEALSAWSDIEAQRHEGRLPSLAARCRLGDPGGPFDLGVHLNLTEGRPLSHRFYPPELLDSQGRFPGVRRLFARLLLHGNRFNQLLRKELQLQVEFLLDHRLRPTHLNGHEYIETIPTVGPLVLEVAARYHVPVCRVAVETGLWQSLTNGGLPIADRALGLVKRYFAGRFARRVRRSGMRTIEGFVGTNHAGHVRAPLLARVLTQAARRCVRTLEVALHPGNENADNQGPATADGWRDPLSALRPEETELLISPELQQLIHDSPYRLGRLGSAREHDGNTEAIPARLPATGEQQRVATA